MKVVKVTKIREKESKLQINIKLKYFISIKLNNI